MFSRAVLALIAALGVTGVHLLFTESGGAGGGDVIVGNGDPMSCNDAALTSALSGGATLVTFNCGPAPVSFIISQKAISATTAIDGGGLITLSGGNANRHFVVLGSGRLTLQNIVLTNGLAVGGGDGGAILNAGTLVLTNSTIQNSNADLRGGAIVSTGALTITNSTLAGNSAQNGGALSLESIVPQVTITGSVLHDNHATGAGPANGRGGAIIVFGPVELLIESSDLHDNAAVYSGGAIHTSSEGASLTLRAGTQIRNNRATAVLQSYGGGIYHESGTMTLTNVTLSGNVGLFGGGILHLSGVAGMATFTDVTLSDNSGSYGGGIYNLGLATLLNATLSGNSVTNSGAGIHNGGSAMLTNVTLSGNSAGDDGGGIYNINAGPLTMINVTLSGNSAMGNGGGIWHFGTAGTQPMSLKNTIIANSGDQGNCYKFPTSVTTIVSAGFNLSDDNSCTPYLNQAGDQNLTAAGLGPLAINGSGGHTLTHLPMPGSLAIDHGTGAGCPSTDQRLRPRPVGKACDVGAVEVQTSELATHTPTRTATATSTSSATNTRTPTASSTSPGAATATGSATATPTIPGTPTATSTGTPSPTGTQGAVTSTVAPTSTNVPAPGADGFSLLTNPSGPVLAQARWTPGTGQTGFKGYRLAPSTGALTTFPAGAGVLPPDAASFDDPAPGAIGCYFTGVLGGNPPGTLSYGISDVICLFRGLASGAAPPNFKAQLNGPLVILTWAAPGGRTGYTLDIIRLDGTSPTSEDLGAGATSTFYNTDGAIICFRLRTMGIAGQTDMLCPIPNAGTPGVAGATAREHLDHL